MTEADIDDTMVVGNFALVNSHNPKRDFYNFDDIIEIIKKEKRFLAVWGEENYLGWKWHNELYVYQCEKSRSPFVTIIFYRKDV